MRRIRGAVLLAALGLTACVPPGAPRTSGDDATKRPPTPRIEPVLEGLLDEAPIWEARPAAVNATTISASTYIVKPGEGLRAIGEATGAGFETLARVNNIAPPYLLKPGQALRVPAGKYHRVSAGETGIAIARAYGMPWAGIVAENALMEPYALRTGQRLLLPGAAITAETRAAAFKIGIDDIATGGSPAETATDPGLPPTTPAFGGRFTWPLSGAVAEKFGPVGEGRINRGIEIEGTPGSEIRAAADGTVAFVGNGGSAGYGGLILLRHGDGWISAYGRAGQATVARGQNVRAGQIIGTVGDEAKVHFELRRNRMAVDPLKQLPVR